MLSPSETAPRSGRQFLALVRNPNTGNPTWAVVQLVPDIPNDPDFRPYWRWQVPSLTTGVELIGWVCEVPFNDVAGDYAVEGTTAWRKHGV